MDEHFVRVVSPGSSEQKAEGILGSEKAETITLDQDLLIEPFDDCAAGGGVLNLSRWLKMTVLAYSV